METGKTPLTLEIQNFSGERLEVVTVDGGKRVNEAQLSKVKVIANILAVGVFLTKHYPKTDVAGNSIFYPGSLITYNKNFDDEKLYINFREKPGHPWEGIEIDGQLQINQELSGWRLNEGDFMATQQAVEFVRARAHHFASAQEVKTLIETLRNFEVAFEQVRRNTDDGRGKIEQKLDEEIRFKAGEIPKDLRIVLPLFKGSVGVKTLNLEIELKRRGNDVCMAFYCLELETVLRSTADAIMEQELEQWRDHFVVLEQQ